MVNWLIKRAMRTPYYHIADYMERYWLVPYNVVIERKPFADAGYKSLAPGGLEDYTVTDGTGPVTWRRPIAKLLQLCGIAARVHHILRSDAGRDPHDHPWPYLTVILKGGYFEECFDEEGAPIDTRWRGAGSILFRRANSLHKLRVPSGETAWTLFITGKKQQTWGFKPPGQPKVPHWQYVGEV